MSNSSSSYWLIFQGERLLLQKIGNEINLPTDASLGNLKSNLKRQLPLGELNNHLCFCAELDEQAFIPPDFEFFTLRKAFEILGAKWYPAAVKAYSVIQWDKTHQFCGHCGNTTVHLKLEMYERICSVCGLTFYPRISPSIIVLIKKDQHLLMARSPHFTPGVFGLIAGFVEAGENLEEAVHREVLEEVNLTIKNLNYFCSQPWPFPNSLMVGFIADYASGEIKIDKTELEAADWYRYDNLPLLPSPVSISRKLIDHFVAEQKKL